MSALIRLPSGILFAVFNQVLWTLDRETECDTFERLCVDLLYRTGYSDITPVARVHPRGHIHSFQFCNSAL